MKNKNEISLRVWIAFSCCALLAVAVIVKIFVIQLKQEQRWVDTGKRFEQQVRPIVPERGQILASDGSLLASSVPVYNLYWDSRCEGLDQELFEEQRDSLCLKLAEHFPSKTIEEYDEILSNAIIQKNRYAKILRGIDHLQKKEAREFPLIRKGRYKSGFIFEKINVRMKPFGKLASRTIGIDRKGERVGLERAYNRDLAGKEGSQLQEKIAGQIWKPISDDFIVEPVPGADLRSTIDVNLQDIAETALEEQLTIHQGAWGCVVLMEVETGYVKAIANLVRGTGENEDKFYEEFNYAIGHPVEPGSTFKLPAMMAALESGLIDPDDGVDMGDGRRYYYGSKIDDSNRDQGGHGVGTVSEVFKFSSNIGMAEISEKCWQGNKQKYLDHLNQLGIHDTLGINIKGETAPKIYRETGEGNWSGISHIWMSMGYEVAQSPIQTLAFYNAVANDGQMMKPLFAEAVERNGKTIKTIEPVVLRNKIASQRTIDACKRMMEMVVEPEGTAEHAFKNAPYSIAGKTGTAWLYENGAYQTHRYRGSFVGYFPADKPKYSCIVVMHDPSGGYYYGSTIAAPVVKKLADYLHATELYQSQEIEDSEMIASTKIPISKNGSREELTTVFQSMGIPVMGDPKANWIATSTKTDHVQLNEKEIQNGMVPDVRGMGLQDALFLLENAGLKVQVNGFGTVKKQSMTPGGRITEGATIKIDLS